MAMSQPVSRGATALATRTPEEIFAHHAQALGAEDLEAIVIDYAENACFIGPTGVLRGKDAVREFFAGVFQILPKAQWSVKTAFVDDVLFLEWTADSAKASVSDGVDTFVFQDGLIRAQTVRCTIVPKP
jgi:ketosteroid isomerase-like protein